MVAASAVLIPLGWLVSPLITRLLNKACDHLGTGVDEKTKILAAIVFPRLSLAIEKAEKSPDKEKLAEWLKRLKGAYYEAEEAIDLLDYEQLEQKVNDDRKALEQNEENERGNQISLPSQIVPQMVKDSFSIFSPNKIKLKGCIDKLIEIAKEAKEFRDLLEDQENASGHRETTSEPAREVFGRDGETEYIVQLLSKVPLNSEPGPSSRPAIPIIAITGRSGVGKTTLAQYVYKYMDGQNQFDILVWVHTPRKFKATDVIKNMIEIIKAKERASNDYPCTSIEALLTKIRSMLGSKKLLLVLDDFWTDTGDFMEQWEKFIGCLSTCAQGSKILVTTPSKNAAQQAGLAGVTEVETYYLEEIEEEQLLKLFMHYAWPSNSDLQKEEFEKIGQKIVGKLKGDPGAAKLLGHELRGKLDLRHWEEVAQEDWLGSNMKARIWSYQQLPQDIQRCFAICSLFPKSNILPRALIIHLWMAEGYINPLDKKKRLEDIGENYLHELVSRFFLEQVVVVNEKEIYYRLHDLLHDLAERVQGDDLIRIDSTNSREALSHIEHMQSRNEGIRHINLPSSMISELKEKLLLMNNICTFWVKPDGLVPNEVLQEIFKKLKKLRVLYLPECGHDLPDSIGYLKHLRFLHIHASGHSKKLPDSICKLYLLQTLVLPNCKSLPKEFSELLSLRSFKKVGNTISHISHVGRMTSLQDLDQFVVRKEYGNELHQLENLNHLRGELHITGLENVGSITDAEKANIRKKIHLEELEFKWNFVESNTSNATGLSTPHVQILDALQPHSNISAITINGFGGGRLSNWLLSPNSLKHLTSLTLISCDKVVKITSIHESLSNCKSVILQELKNLKEMPSLPANLTSLVISHIPQLSYFSEGELLMKDERKQFKIVAVRQITDYLKLKYVLLPLKVQYTMRIFLKFVKERLEVAPEVSKGSPYENRISELVKYDAFNVHDSRDKILGLWAMFMHCHMEQCSIKMKIPSWFCHLHSLT